MISLNKLILKRKLLVLCFIIFSIISKLCFAEQKKIFFLHSYAATFPWTDQMNLGIKESLASHSDMIFFTEYMDFSRLGYTLNEQDFSEYLSKKYSSVKFDAVFAESNRASRFMNEYRDELFGDIPMVLFSSENLEHKANTYYLKSQQDLAVGKTFKMALEQNPSKKKLIIIHNMPETVNPELLILQSMAKKEDMETTILSDFSLEELYSMIQNLNGDEILFFFPFFYDNTGKRLIPKIVLEQLCKITPSPVYTAWSSLKDSGCTGGVMVDSKKIAHEMFRAVNDFFQTGKYSTSYTTNQAYFNWNAIKKYHIHLDKISEDIIYLNKPIPILKVYFREIMIGISIILTLFLTLTLFGLYHIYNARKKLEEANIELKEAHKKAEELSLHDPLTGLYNRRAAMKIINFEIRRCKRVDIPLSAIIVDIDHFKNINDVYGHETGDKVIKNLSNILTTKIRNTDIVSRWGGEEFLIITSDTPLESANNVAEKLRKVVEEYSFPKDISASISLGVGEYRTSESFEEFFNRIDTALYQAKNQGRNRVCLAKN